MSEIITYPLPTGANFVIPDIGDENWGQNVTDFLVAIPAGTVPTSGNFTLTGDVAFIGGFGLVSPYFKTPTINPSDTGFVRLAKNDTIAWRNTTNGGNNLLAVNGSNQLTYNGTPLSTAAGTVTSVAMTVPTFLSVSGSPITSSGTLAVTLSGTALPVLNGGTGQTTAGNLTDTGTDGITITGGTGCLHTSASLSQHVADASHNGYLSSADWSTFNSAAGGGITSLTGVVTGTGPGATATSFAPSPIFTGTVRTDGQFESTRTTNQIWFLHGGTDQAFINSPAPGSGISQTYSLPDTGVAASNFVVTESAQTINGNKTLSGTTNLSGLTASTALALDSSKNIVSVTNTGSGSNVLATSPTLVTPNLGVATLGGDLNANSHKITNITNGSSAQDAAAFGQIPTIYTGFQAQVFGSENTGGTTSSASFSNIGASASITPTSSAHRIKITISGTMGSSTAGVIGAIGLAKNSTDIFSTGTAPIQFAPEAANVFNSYSMVWVDSPATTSSITYNTRAANKGSGSFQIGGGAVAGSFTTIVLEEIV